MLKSISLKFGSNGRTNSLSFDLTPVTIFVGPNNSGKSLALKDVERYLQMGKNEHGNIVSEIVTELDTNEKLMTKIKELDIELETDGQIDYGLFSVSGSYVKNIFHKQLYHDGAVKEHYAFELFMQYFELRLDGTTRLSLIGNQPTGDLLGKPINRLMELFKDDDKRLRIRKLIYDAFKLYFIIDITGMTHFRIRLSTKEPADKSEEQGVDQRARQFLEEAKSINEFSDGIKAYVGLLIALIAGNSRFFLVDEPEAFLHPPLSKKLGKVLSELISEFDGNLFISTHSSNFLMGCIQSGIPANIVRLTYKNNIPTAKLLPSKTLYPLLYNPMLRSTGVLESLFYENVIVTEADTDRAFYDEINHRLVSFEKEKGIESCLFLNANNLQTVSEIVKPIRDFGIPAAAIIDIDVLNNGGDAWNKTMKACYVPEISFESLRRERTNIKNRFEELGFDMKKGGVSLLTGKDKEACNTLFSTLASYGIFVVPNGELEIWLSYLEVKSNKHDWLKDIFERLGSDPSIESYVKPKNDDVWEFIFRIKKWLEDPNRKGMPE